MQEENYTKQNNQNSKIGTFSVEERNRLVGVFVWLIKEDKKQNPEPYQIKSANTDLLTENTRF